MMEASFDHPWLGTVRRHGTGELIVRIEVPAAIRPARANGQPDAEVLIQAAGAGDPRALADDAAARVRAMLADLEAIRAYAAAQAPRLWHEHGLPPGSAPPAGALFLEGFTISPAGSEIAFDFGELDLIVVRADADGRCQSVSLCP